jgi:hypothetical protein
MAASGVKGSEASRLLLTTAAAQNSNAPVADVMARLIETLYHFVIAVWRAKEPQFCGVKRSWETIAENLSQAGVSWGCSSQIDSTGTVIFTADAYSRAGRRFTVLANERFTAFLELQAAILELE